MQKRANRRFRPVLLALILLALGAVFLSFFIGRYSITPGQALSLLREFLFGTPSGIEGSVRKVLFNIRLPRVIGAFGVGAALALSGNAYQTTLKNPLVSSDILGAAAGAGFGAALGLTLNCAGATIQVLSFGFGLLAVSFTCAIGSAMELRRGAALTLVLVGIVVHALFQALVSLIKYTADPYSKLPAITFWLMGSLASMTWHSLPLFLIPSLAGTIPLLLLRWKINLLSLSDEEAVSIGVNVTALRRTIIVCATLITSSVVSVSGMIGWVGLIVPHMSRMLVGPDSRVQFPVTLLLGGTYLLLVDDTARSLMAMEIPIGILTSLIGAPFFIGLIYRQRRAGS